ncbi:MAG: NAD(P)H-dependent oxidoreductase [Oscillospiraceae bacterium]|nr:NAD(P)H-dependent oxidoreductase [Oscillospiraceae bacterium]
MKICAINGSPKGKYSITLQTVLYLKKHFPQHSFSVIHAGQRIKSMEKDMGEALAAIGEAELLLFSYPVYTFLAPSQLHRFIELLKASGTVLSGKYATQLTTSKHFYDVTAHRYVEDNCHDMGLKVIHGLSADMEDMLTAQGQKDAEAFLQYAAWCVENGVCEPAPEPKPLELPQYSPSLPAVPKKEGFDTVIVADLRKDDARLSAMIEDFISVYPYPVRIVNISEFPFQGGCLGCFRCAGDGKCVYKDGFDSFLREQIQAADALVYAFTIRDHSMGSRFKMYDDRQFCNGHRTVTECMPFGYIVNGDYESEQNLKTVIEARSEVGHNFLAGVGTDAASINAMSKRLTYALEHKYVLPRNFYGVGGMKIFRDLIWLMRGLMKADHDFYKKHGIYDFPQKKRGQMIKMKLLGALVRNPKISAKMGNKMNEGMIAPYQKVIGAMDADGK